ncbi:phosphotransferase system, lactose/cellobiose-specific IIB subunit [Alkaliphilus metalliredigens QYMF]|uniref:Phosphotransferase system, lactose/cellobiose-specific IIB subunit n=1 Tax=Alkaliphilus metalliredigens (strain QYMF) TaxID=293826 RepID=A6TVQ8_ALKMQ|nr:PTS sugar transporter subunit IIB [Alkaliphilus metalliredigens]ABR50276.1 phosphotransferase system, lactose/cellobiose-specific IIB subunit [Alkaliphilus metalliredigens QYMF]
MKRVMLVCSAGMSTSLLVTKMNIAAVKTGVLVEIFAVSESDASKHFDHIDVLLLGPQVRYLLGKMEKTLAGRGVPVAIIDGINYGRMNGDAVLEQALKLLE